MPCNLNQRELAQHVKRGIRAAGGTPMEFNTISVSDGVSMGTEGMRALARLARGDRRLDRARRARPPVRRPRLPRRLRQDDPGGGDGARAPRHARASSSTTARSRPGRFRGRDVTIQDVFEAVGAHAAGKIDGEELHALESVACPGAGACGGQFTANTMSMALDFLGISPAGPERRSRRSTRRRRRAAEEAGRLVDGAASRDDVRPSQIITREAIENAIAVGRRHRRLDERRAPPARDRLRARHPALDRRLRHDRRAHARSSPASSRAAASSPPTSTRPAASRSSPASCVKRDARPRRRAATSTAARSARSPTARRGAPGQEVVVPIETPLKPTRRARASCAATSRPRAAW